MPITHELRATGWRGWPVVGVVLTLLLGVANLPLPYHGDQALFAVYGRMMAGGAVLYRDVWDVKQPGIFMTYRLIGGLFGFGEVPIHAFELGLLLVAIVTGMFVLRRRFGHTLALGALPVLSIGFVYLGARTSELAQLETFAIPLVAVVVWALFCTHTRPILMWFLAGCAAALIVLFKSVLLIMPLALFGYALHSRPDRDRGGSGRLLASALAGYLLPCMAFAVWMVSHNLEHRIWYTFVTYPLHASSGDLRDLSRLIRSGGAFVVRFAPLLVLAAVRVRHLATGVRDRFSVAMVVWLAAGSVTVLLQLWWSYLFLVMVPPLAILAAEGLDDLLDRSTFRRRWVVGIAVLTLPVVGIFALKEDTLATNGFAIGSNRGEQYREAASGSYAAAVAEVASVDVASDIYVIGDPLILYVAGARQALPPQAWSVEAWDDETRRAVVNSMVKNPPEEIFVSTESLPWIEGTEVEDVIALGYHEIHSSDNGVWYQRGE